MIADAERARSLVLRTFAWSDGHADFTGVFHDPATLAALGPGLVEPFRAARISVVVAAEARGFILGSLCALELGVGFVPARKPGSIHPGPKVTVTSDRDWRGHRHTFRLAEVLGPSDRVLLVDDWIETGSQANAIASAVSSMGAARVGVAVIVDQAPPEIGSALNAVGLINHTDLPSEQP